LLDIQSLDSALNSIEMAAGTGWLEEHTHRIKDIEDKKSSQAIFGEYTALGVPPLAYIWYKAREILALGYILGNFNPGYWGLTAAWLGQNIVKVADIGSFASLMGRLKGAEEFRAACGELYIAAGYLTLGAGVSFTSSGGGFIVAPGQRIICQAGTIEVGPASDRVGILLKNYHEIARGFVDSTESLLIYLDVMLGPGEEPEKVLAALAEKLSGLIKAGGYQLILISSIMEGTPGKERLRLWSEKVRIENSQPSPYIIYLPRLVFPV